MRFCRVFKEKISEIQVVIHIIIFSIQHDYGDTSIGILKGGRVQSCGTAATDDSLGSAFDKAGKVAYVII